MLYKCCNIDINNISLIYQFKQTKTNNMKQLTVISIVFAAIVLVNLSAWGLL